MTANRTTLVGGSQKDSKPVLALSKETKGLVQLFLLNQPSEKTRIAYEKDLRDLFLFVRVASVRSLNKAHLVAFRIEIEKRLAKSSVYRKIACIRSFFKFLFEEGAIEKDPSRGLKGQKLPLEGKTPEFSDQEVRAILAAPDIKTVKGLRDRAMLEFLFYLGLRVSELVNIQMGDFFKEGSVKALRILGKGSKERFVPLQPHLIKSIQAYIKASKRTFDNAKSYLFTPVRNPFNRDLEKAISARSVWVMVKKYAKKAGISKHVTPHSGRVTATGNALDHNAGLIELSHLMGWASVQMVQKYDRRRKALKHSPAKLISYGNDY